MRFTDFTAFDLVLLAQGLGVNLALFLGTSLIGLVIGIAWAIVRYYCVPVLSACITFFSELLKNSPVLVQLFLVFFGLPGLLHIRVTPVTAAAITLSANTAAFVYVIAVSGIESIGRDQLEAARVFGLSRRQVLRHIVAPQAAAFAVGPLIALLVNQLQVTSLISVIGVVDLTKIGNILNMRTLKPFVVWTAVGLLYFAAAKLVAYAGSRFEKRLRAHSAWRGL
ncbi:MULTISPECIES: amino acid ABC transporter permease [unclassified Rhizobium]|uniref:amino acid ABC transporter permease n=1 Tax=unclassified Rhizobium TaxID=2613769 RepID=UPI0016135D9D|nr:MULTISPECIES: amino acid ABC transporter permease [unclassified Rhizobium]MBB3318825.1 His/Glu/Gln/Arg/opine family amino acid ABC transporter permease subunit [Rhizobium sp. BK181]MCS3742373.1 His/Glu/Gln/Arg/opine family amino acid ABC transporter permease subunit [Rhizobium sp. BK661]MCS4094799.1 His/Glu/Gln/Arg/opine family amino acid ABC transporter permease subunit [Rhizobium sp. BK176]